jgi:hypothetical protein
MYLGSSRVVSSRVLSSRVLSSRVLSSRVLSDNFLLAPLVSASTNRLNQALASSGSGNSGHNGPKFILRILRSYIHMLAQGTNPPFIHAKPFRHVIETGAAPLEVCRAMAQTFTSRAIRGHSSIWESVRSEKARLFELVNPSTFPLIPLTVLPLLPASR